ncbi:MAG: D-sedoheptulose 7-phosphate isomerase [Bacteroidales bacterium]|nr:D-sedoheptulose 7-phosphate isomerase [Bacteroidales bacterium]HPO66411.1 D-sedoheptulose 7-phosphate isomerase [Bacteroidales bacterium]
MIKKEFEEALAVLQKFISDDSHFAQMEKAGDLMVEAIKGGHKILSCGNGGSMCDAMHFAEELSGQYRKPRAALPAIAISDSSHITCAANDYGFDSIFSRYIEAMGQAGDVLLAISTSGNSPNIVKAAQTAQSKNMKVVALTGKDGGKLSQIADIEIRVPHNGFSDRIQEIHIKIIHSLIHYIEQQLFYK